MSGAGSGTSIPDLKQLQDLSTSLTGSNDCWARRARAQGGVAKEYIEWLDARNAAGDHISKAGVTRALRELGLRGDVGNHIRGTCKCPRD